MKPSHLAGLVLGYGLLAGALLAVLTVVLVVGRAVFGAAPVGASVFTVMVAGGGALFLGIGGVTVLQRVRHPAARYGANLDWGRVLGP